MKKFKIIAMAALAASAVLFSGCYVNRRAAENVIEHLTPPPKDWYMETIKYYAYGVHTNWKDNDLYGDVCAELKDPDNHAGYYLTDLNNDGTKELLVGFDDGGDTKFTDIYIYHPDLKDHVVNSFHAAGEGYYIYLCEGDVIRNDWEYPGQKEPKSDYMKLNKDPVSGWPIQTYDSDPPKPVKCELTTFASHIDGEK
ncbi:MAG: hypothetical protein J6F31_03805 [Oscillospiraceae bacterium]|nr:hypothetical protein [Oscillospiraceae bacterium]